MESPKKRFLRTPAAKAHFELTATSSFEQAMDAALLQHVWDNSTSTNDPEQAAAGFNRICGAVQFAKTLMGIGTDTKPETIKDTSNLDHRTK